VGALGSSVSVAVGGAEVGLGGGVSVDVGVCVGGGDCVAPAGWKGVAVAVEFGSCVTSTNVGNGSGGAEAAPQAESKRHPTKRKTRGAKSMEREA
jgi:hypothetical protein